jgi:primosomal protein N' (replication factor Y)
MPFFCDVAVAVPLDMAFTYSIPDGANPVLGGRVLVPFRQQRMSGIVVDLHDRPPSVKTKNILQVLDSSPVLSDQLLRLGRWIADYYLAPIGEVFRSMLPLSAEFKKSIAYRITEQGHMALHLAGVSGSSGRSQRTPEEQLTEFRVLDFLVERDWIAEQSLRSSTRASRQILSGMVRKKWLAREDVSGARDAARLIKMAVLLKIEDGGTPGPNNGAPGAPAPPPQPDNPAPKKLNTNQRTLIETLAAAGGRVQVEALQALDIPRTTLSTLVKRGLIEIQEEPAEFHVSRMKARSTPFQFELNAAQKNALKEITQRVSAKTFGGMLLHGVTGSGKTAVYLAAMRQVLDQGRSSILLVPEIGLTPAVAADLHQVFADEVAILHSALTNQERANSGIVSSAGSRAWSAHAPPSSRPCPISRLNR